MEGAETQGGAGGRSRRETCTWGQASPRECTDAAPTHGRMVTPPRSRPGPAFPAPAPPSGPEQHTPRCPPRARPFLSPCCEGRSALKSERSVN